MRNCSVDSVQQPEYDLFSQSGATRIKGFKVSFVTDGTREEDRAALLGRGRILEPKILLFKLTTEGNPGKSVASCHSMKVWSALGTGWECLQGMFGK